MTMQQIEVQEFHDCPKPSIPLITIEKDVERRTWWGKRYIAKVTHTRFVYTHARWDCECGAEWTWHAFEETGYWHCIARPDVWKTINL